MKVASGFACAGVIFAALGADYYFQTVYVTGALIFILAIGSAIEFCSMLRKKGIYLPELLIVATVGMVTLFPILCEIKAEFSFELFLTTISLILVFGVIGAYAITLTKKPVPEGALSVAFTVLGLLHIGLGFCFFAAHLLMDIEGPRIALVALFIFVVKANDILAYLLGSTFGRKGTLSPISPNKSIEGSLFGFLGGIGISVLVGYLFGLPDFKIWKAVVYGVVVGPLSQVGDLAESMLKRYCGVKDSSSIIPASGGLFDFADCFLLAAPASYFLTLLLSRF